MSNRFHQIEIGKKFKRDPQGSVFVKVSKIGAHLDGFEHDPEAYRRINSQALVELVEETVDLDTLEFHTFDFTDAQLAKVIGQIVARVAEDYPHRNIDGDRLRKGLYAAHRTKPIRLIALLNSCALDFPTDVILGVYRHYDPKTDSIKDGWTAQHAEPHNPYGFLSFLFDEEEDDDEYNDYHSSY